MTWILKPTTLGKNYQCRGVDRGGAQGGQIPSPPEFGRSVNPIQTRGADYAPHTTASPPGFKMLSTPLISQTCLNIRGGAPV